MLRKALNQLSMVVLKCNSLRLTWIHMWDWYRYTKQTDIQKAGKGFSSLWHCGHSSKKAPTQPHTHALIHTNTHTFSSVQPPLLSIYKHPNSLTGLSTCTTTGGGGKENERDRGRGFAMREDIRACKFAQWLKREDKEKNEEKWVGGWWNRCIKKHERMARGLQEQHLALEFFPKEQERRHQAGDTNYSWKFYTFCALDIMTFFNFSSGIF